MFKRLEDIFIGIFCILFPLLMAAALISGGKAVKIHTLLNNKVTTPHQTQE